MTAHDQLEQRAAEATAFCSFERSAQEIAKNKAWMPGGVSSNFRLGMAPTPLVIEHGEGPYLYDVDGNRLIDYYLAMGPMILGHNPRAVIDAARAQLDKGILFAGQTRVEAEAAQRICDMVPCAEQLRFCTSGSETIQGAIRLARAATGRDTILKFEGHYHGWFDNVLWSVAPPPDAAGPRDAPNRVPGSKGQLASSGDVVDVLPWNDLEALEKHLAGGDVAAVIMEPAMCNSGAIHPAPGYLEGVRAACDATGTVLVFDEIITGFRVAPGGAQERLGVTPDLATFGKAIANGFPVAAIAGRSDLLNLYTQGVLHGGTYNAHPVAMAATAATLAALTPDMFAAIEKQGRALMEGLATIFAEEKVAATVTGFPQIFHVGLGLKEPAHDYRDLARIDKAAYSAFCAALLKRGVRVLERGAWFMSCEHGPDVIAETLDAAGSAVRELKRNGVV